MKHSWLSPCLPVVLLALAAAPSTVRAETTQKGIVVLVQFPDVRHQVDRTAVEMRFARQLHAYVREMSYGQVSLEVDVTRKWYTLPEPVGRYRISSRNLEVDRSRISKLIDDALEAADAEVNFGNYAFTAVAGGVGLIRAVPLPQQPSNVSYRPRISKDTRAHRDCFRVRQQSQPRALS